MTFKIIHQYFMQTGVIILSVTSSLWLAETLKPFSHWWSRFDLSVVWHMTPPEFCFIVKLLKWHPPPECSSLSRLITFQIPIFSSQMMQRILQLQKWQTSFKSSQKCFISACSRVDSSVCAACSHVHVHRSVFVLHSTAEPIELCVWVLNKVQTRTQMNKCWNCSQNLFNIAGFFIKSDVVVGGPGVLEDRTSSVTH